MTPLSGLNGLEELLLILTADCNLRCSYCFQQRRRAGAMPWPVVEASLDFFLASPGARMVSMTGGEPLLEFDTVRRIIERVRTRQAAGGSVAFHVVTNGTPLAPGVASNEETLAFLVANGVRLDLSFDGVRAAQDLRAPGTFDRLDALLRLLASSYPHYLRSHVVVSLTVSSAAIPHLAASFDYLLGKQVPEILIQPAMGQEPWRESDIEALDQQFAHVWHSSLLHYLKTGTVVFTRFRPAGKPRPYARTWGCSAPLGGALAVDVDGQAYPCTLFARSYRRFPRELDERTRHLSLGDVRDPRLRVRLAGRARASRRSGLFDPKRLQHAGDRECASCEFVRDCFVCPVARALGTRGGDINAVPADLCAFNRVILKWRDRFPVRKTRAETIRAMTERLGGPEGPPIRRV